MLLRKRFLLNECDYLSNLFFSYFELNKTAYSLQNSLKNIYLGAIDKSPINVLSVSVW